MANSPPKKFLFKEGESLCSECCDARVTLDLMCIYRKTHGAEKKQWVCRPAQAAGIRPETLSP